MAISVTARPQVSLATIAKFLSMNVIHHNAFTTLRARISSTTISVIVTLDMTAKTVKMTLMNVQRILARMVVSAISDRIGHCTKQDHINIFGNRFHMKELVGELNWLFL